MGNIYRPEELLNKKYTTKRNFEIARRKSLSLLKRLYQNKQIVSGSLFGAAARGDYKRGSDIDIFIITFDKSYNNVVKELNNFSLEIRDKLNIPLDLHLHKESSLKKGNTYYDPSFVSHLIEDCPKSVKVGISLERLIKTGWSAKEAVNARIRLAKLDLARLQSGLEYHKKNMDGYFLGGLQKLFSRTQHTTRNMLFIFGELEKYKSRDRSKKALLKLYLKKFKSKNIYQIEAKIINAEKRYNKILEKTIRKIENGSKDIQEYKRFLLSLDYLVPLAIKFFDLNLDLLNSFE